MAPDTGDYIRFPDPSNSYMGMATEYTKDCVYVIWFDAPTSPQTPDYANLRRKDYQVRYWDVQHSLAETSLLNPRPTLSGLNDHQVKKHVVTYEDQHTKKQVVGQRVVILLSTYEQYSDIHRFGLFNENVNWLNWGKTKLPAFSAATLLSEITDIVKTLIQILPEAAQIVDATIKLIREVVEDLYDYQTVEQLLLELIEQLSEFLHELPPDITKIVQDIISKIQVIIRTALHQLSLAQVPTYGSVIIRELIPSPEYKESIQNYVLSGPNCLQKTIPVPIPGKPEDVPLETFPWCNPGNPSLCKEKGYDPCCLSRDLLKHMKEHYPRCEKIKICDLQNAGVSFWDKYLYGPLPYLYDEPRLPENVCCRPKDIQCQRGKTTACGLSDNCISDLESYAKEVEQFMNALPPKYDSVRVVLENLTQRVKDVAKCSSTPDDVDRELRSIADTLRQTASHLPDSIIGKYVRDRLQGFADKTVNLSNTCKGLF